MFCSKCGINLPEDANVCYKCAMPTLNYIRQVEPQFVQSSSDGQNETPQIIVKNNSNVGSALVLIALLAGCVFAYVKYRENQSIFSLNVRKDGEISSSLNVEKLFESPSSTPNKRVQNTPNTETYKEPISVNTGEPISTDMPTCQIVSNFDTVNLRQNCDTSDCQNDPGTIAARVAHGETVKVLGTKVQGTNFDWVEIEFAGGRYYVASSKLSCFLGE